MNPRYVLWKHQEVSTSWTTRLLAHLQNCCWIVCGVYQCQETCTLRVLKRKKKKKTLSWFYACKLIVTVVKYLYLYKLTNIDKYYHVPSRCGVWYDLIVFLNNEFVLIRLSLYLMIYSWCCCFFFLIHVEISSTGKFLFWVFPNVYWVK